MKQLLCSDLALKSQDFSSRLIIQTDAAKLGVSAVLSPLDDDEGEEHLVAFASRKFRPEEQRYSTIEQKCLAI